jgi:hypothetical protein
MYTKFSTESLKDLNRCGLKFGRYELNSGSWEQDLLANFHEQCNEMSGCIRDGIIIWGNFEFHRSKKVL